MTVQFIPVPPTYAAHYDTDRPETVKLPVVALAMTKEWGTALVLSDTGQVVRCDDEDLPGAFQGVFPVEGL